MVLPFGSTPNCARAVILAAGPFSNARTVLNQCGARKLKGSSSQRTVMPSLLTAPIARSLPSADRS